MTTKSATTSASSPFKAPSPSVSSWLAHDFVLQFEPRWFHTSLAPYINDHHHRALSRYQLDALLRSECPGGVSMSLVSDEFRDMISARLAVACNDTHSQEHRLLNSLHGLQLDTVIPGWHTFMTHTIHMLRRLLGHRANLDMSYQSSFAIRYVAHPPAVYSPASPAPAHAHASSPSLPFLSASRQPIVQPPQPPSLAVALGSKVVEDPAVVQRHVRGRIESAEKKGSLLHFMEPPLGFTLPPNYRNIMGHNIHDIVAAVGGEVPHQDKQFYATTASSSTSSSSTIAPSSSHDSKAKSHGHSHNHSHSHDGEEIDGGDRVANHFEHSDECDLTMNISIGDIFEGGQLLLAARSYLPNVPPLVRIPEYEATPLSVTPLVTPTHASGDRVVGPMVPPYTSPRLALPLCHMNHVSYSDMLHVLPLMARQCATELSPSITAVVQGSLRHVAQLNYFAIKQQPGRAIFHAGRQVHATMPVTSGSRVNIIVMMNALSYFTSWCHLPVTIQVHVLKFLTPMTDILAVRATNRANHSLTHDASLWRYLYTIRYGSSSNGIGVNGMPSSSSSSSSSSSLPVALPGAGDPHTLMLLAQLQAQQAAMAAAMLHQQRAAMPSLSSGPLPQQPRQPQQQQQQQQVDSSISGGGMASALCESTYMTRWHTDRHNERMLRYNQLQQARTLRHYQSPYHPMSRSRQPYYAPPTRVAAPMPPSYAAPYPYPHPHPYGHPAGYVPGYPFPPPPMPTPGSGYGHVPHASRQALPSSPSVPSQAPLSSQSPYGYAPTLPTPSHLSMVRHAQPPAYRPSRQPAPPPMKMGPMVPPPMRMPMMTRPPPMMPMMPTFVVNDAPVHDADITPPHCFIQ